MTEHDVKVLNDLADALIGVSGWTDDERAEGVAELLSRNVNIPDLIDTITRVCETGRVR